MPEIASAGMPMPLSRTRTSHRPPACRAVVTLIVLFSKLNLTAFRGHFATPAGAAASPQRSARRVPKIQFPSECLAENILRSGEMWIGVFVLIVLTERLLIKKRALNFLAYFSTGS
jgi:hypothetical protein